MPDVIFEDFQGAAGKWDFQITTERGNNLNPKPADTIRIQYTPKQAANGCGKIVFLQVVRTVLIGIDAQGNFKTLSKYKTERDAYKNPAKYDRAFGHLADDTVEYTPYEDFGAAPDRAKPERWVVDHAPCEADPYYNGDDNKDNRIQNGKRTQTQGDARTAAPAVMFDTPARDVSRDFKNDVLEVILKFEVCAICATTGACLGSIRWSMTARRGFRLTRGPNAGRYTKDFGTIWLDPPKQERTCSGRCSAALRQFLSTHNILDAGVRKWRCPDGGGRTGDPIPPDLYNRYTQNLPRELAPVRDQDAGSGGGSETPPEGGGTKHGSLRQAIQEGSRDAGRTALKFTWAGPQTKTRPSITLSPYHPIGWKDLAPFSFDASLRNDKEANGLTLVGDVWMRSALDTMQLLSPILSKSKGDALLTVMTGLGTEKAAAWMGALSPSALSALARLLATLPGGGERTKAQLEQADLHMGVGGFPLSGGLTFKPLPRPSPEEEQDRAERALDGRPRLALDPSIIIEQPILLRIDDSLDIELERDIPLVRLPEVDGT